MIPYQYSRNRRFWDVRGRGYAAVVAMLLLYGLIFVLLSIDIMVRVWDWRFRFESPVDVIVLLYFEGSRALVTLAGLTVAAIAVWRADRHPSQPHPALSYLAVAAAFMTVAYTKAVAYDAFPGAVQQQVASALYAARVPQWLLLVLFQRPEWAFWPGVAALLLFAACYPRDLDGATVRQRPEGERAGTLHSVALAGADVGTVARGITARLLEGGWLRESRVWLAGAFVGAAHTAAVLHASTWAGTWVNIAAVVLTAGVAVVVVTLLRAGMLTGSREEAAPIRWLARGAALSLALLAVSGVAGALLPGGIVSIGAITLAPAVLVTATLLAVLAVPGASAPAVR
jgi:hypothetical protein